MLTASPENSAVDPSIEAILLHAAADASYRAASIAVLGYVERVRSNGDAEPMWLDPDADGRERLPTMQQTLAASCVAETDLSF